MSISAAYRDIVAERQTPEFAEYMKALFRYKDESKRWKAVRQTNLKHSENALERLQYYEAKERFSRESRIYSAAKNTYETFRILMRTDQLSPKKVAQMMDIKIPKSLDDLIAEARSIAPIVSMTTEQETAIREAALKNIQESQSTKEQFLRSHNRELNDPTYNDDTPLP